MWVIGSVFLPALVAAGLSAGSAYGLRGVARRLGIVAAPRPDRWHSTSTPLLGGVAMWLAVVLALPWFIDSAPRIWIVVGPASILFLLGLFDDIWPVAPTTKLLGQLVAAAVVVMFGSVLHFTPFATVNLLLSFIWIVAITNAFNLLDNMDGLSAGVAFVACVFLLAPLLTTESVFVPFLAILAGATFGFLLFNRHPASIFMGDCGSLFIGFVLAVVTLEVRGHSSQLFSVVFVPVLVLLIPIADMMLVTIARLREGRPISQGGRDHSSHRLVVLGLSEDRAVALLVSLAAIGGVAAIILDRLPNALALTLLPVVLVPLGIGAIYLGDLKIRPVGEVRQADPTATPLWVNITSRRMLFEMLLDFLLFGFAYYLSYLIRFEQTLTGSNLSLFVFSLPIVAVTKVGAFWVLGVYRGIWRQASIRDVRTYVKGVALGSVGAILVLVGVFRFIGYSRTLFVIDLVLSILFVCGARLSFRLLDDYFRGHAQTGEPVLIYGAGQAGVLLAREIAVNRDLQWRVLGFIDDDPDKHGRQLLGFSVFDSASQLERILMSNPGATLIVSTVKLSAERCRRVDELCRRHRVRVKRFRIMFEDAAIPADSPLFPSEIFRVLPPPPGRDG